MKLLPVIIPFPPRYRLFCLLMPTEAADVFAVSVAGGSGLKIEALRIQSDLAQIAGNLL